VDQGVILTAEDAKNTQILVENSKANRVSQRTQRIRKEHNASLGFVKFSISLSKDFRITFIGLRTDFNRRIRGKYAELICASLRFLRFN
jgi:hypothetical protein